MNFQSDSVKKELEEVMGEQPCPECRGRRLRKEALAVTVGDRNLAQLSDMNIRAARAFLQECGC